MRTARRDRNPRGPRRAAAAVELVLMLPMLGFVMLAALDYSRLFYAYAILADCARNGAVFASDSGLATSTTFTTIQQAAQADAGNLSPAPTIASTSGTDVGGNNYVEVTASYTFHTLINYPTIPGFPTIPNSVALSRKLRMVVTP